MNRARKFIYQYESYEPSSNKTLFGSRTASRFLRDAAKGLNSVDIITIGDSNVGSGGSCGYQFGLAAACAANGIPNYSTPLYPCSGNEGANNRTGGMHLPLNNVCWSGLDGNLSTLHTKFIGPPPKNDAVELASALQINNSMSFQWGFFNSWPEPYGFKWDAAFVSNGQTYTSPGNGTCIRILRPSPFTEGINGTGEDELQYRLVHGLFKVGGSGGQFKLTCMTGVNDIEYASSNFVSTYNAASAGWKTEKLNFLAPTVLDKGSYVPATFHCAYDGYNAGNSYQITGPFCALAHSIIRKNKKGFSVTNLVYAAGRTSEELFNMVVMTGGLKNIYLKELRERQIEAGGTGRVIIWCNSGVNGPDQGDAWNDAMTGISNAFSVVWAELGYPAEDLAFVFSVTHPQAAEGTGVEVSLSAIREKANNWANEQAGSGKNISVVDLSKILGYQDLVSRNLYQTYNNTVEHAHLSESVPIVANEPVDRYDATYQYDAHILNNGYAVLSNIIVKNMILQAESI